MFHITSLSSWYSSVNFGRFHGSQIAEETLQMKTRINFNDMEITSCTNFDKCFSLLHLMIVIYWCSQSWKFKKSLFQTTLVHAASELKFWQIHNGVFWLVSSQCQNSEKNSVCWKKNQRNDVIKLKHILSEFVAFYHKSSDEALLSNSWKYGWSVVLCGFLLDQLSKRHIMRATNVLFSILLSFKWVILSII